MNKQTIITVLITALTFVSCSSDEPRYADPEAHEKYFFC